MKRLLSYQSALYGSLIVFGVFFLFHLFVILGISFLGLSLHEQLWGGRLSTDADLLRFEFVSIGVQCICILAILAEIKLHGRKTIASALVRVVIWILFGLFVLNSIGNLLAKSRLEQIIFTPITVLLAIFMLRIGLEARSKA